MIRISIKKAAQLTGAEIIDSLKTTRTAGFINTDSRTIKSGEIFVALKGEKFDGHNYIEKAYEKGALAAIVSEKANIPAGLNNILLVKDTLVAYQKLSAYARLKSDYKVIAITGSVGKTSTRQMIFSALSACCKAYSTQGNNNNEIGVPLTIFSAPDDTDALILEMGMRGLGQIAVLSEIAKPDIAVITNIGMSHIEILKSKDNIYKAKKEILTGLSDEGTLILNVEDTYLRKLCNESFGKIKTVAITSSSDNDFRADLTLRATEIDANKNFVAFNLEICPYMGNPYNYKNAVIPVPGIHNVMNALAAIAAGIQLDYNPGDLFHGLMDYKNVNNRQKIYSYGMITIIDDSYNCSPESLEASIKLLAEYPAEGKKIAVLGGMLELGDYEAREHLLAGEKCAKEGIDEIVTLGKLGKYINQGAEKFLISEADESKLYKIVKNHNFERHEDMVSYLLKNIDKNDVILIKGSRAFNMDKVSLELQKHFEKELRSVK